MTKQLRKIMGAAFAIVALAGFTGCETMKSDTPEGQDKRITSAVKDKLKNNSVYKFRNVQVATANKTVQLSGFTDDPGEKQAAEQAARKVEGVKDVTNQITLQR